MGNIPLWMILLFAFFFFKIFRFGFFGFSKSSRAQRYNYTKRSARFNSQEEWDVPINYEEQTVDSLSENTIFDNQHSFCIACGIKLLSVTKFCTNCGTNHITSGKY